MQIHLFSNYNITKSRAKDLSRLNILRFSFDSQYVDSLNSNASLLQPGVFNRIVELSKSPRKYRNVLGYNMDSHFIMELVGANQSSGNCNYMISIEDHLALVLNVLCNADPDKVKAMHDYSRISDSLINLNTDDMDITLGSFLGLDRNLDEYLNTTITYSEEESMLAFLTDLIRISEIILSYIGFHFSRECIGSVRSITHGKVCINSAVNLDDNIELVFNDYTHNLKITKCVKGDLSSLKDLEVHRI